MLVTFLADLAQCVGLAETRWKLKTHIPAVSVKTFWPLVQLLALFCSNCYCRYTVLTYCWTNTSWIEQCGSARHCLLSLCFSFTFWSAFTDLYPLLTSCISRFSVLLFFAVLLVVDVPSVLWCCWLGGRKGIRPVKNRVVGYWHGYLSGARCRHAYGPADATATHSLLLQ